jgi:hypothetical protein
MFKVGDKVVLYSGLGGRTIYVLEIERETPTQFVLTDGSKFYKKDNRLVGDYYAKVYEFTPELEIKKQAQDILICINSKLDDLYLKKYRIRIENIDTLKTIHKSLCDIEDLIKKENKPNER